MRTRSSGRSRRHRLLIASLEANSMRLVHNRHDRVMLMFTGYCADRCHLLGGCTS